MGEAVVSPAQRTLDGHLRAVRFLHGVGTGRWQVLAYAFPHLYVRAVGHDPESGRLHPHDFHLVCDDYPETPPFVERWAFDSTTESLGVRPPTPSSGSPGYVDALKDWNPADNIHGGIYRAWQRHAASHNGWAAKRPDEAWSRNREIVFVMEQLYGLVSEQACWLASHNS